MDTRVVASANPRLFRKYRPYGRPSQIAAYASSVGAAGHHWTGTVMVAEAGLIEVASIE